MSSVQAMKKVWLIAAAGLAALAWFALLSPPAPAQVKAGVTGIFPGAEGQFQRAEGVRAFAFPRDHGPHPDFQTEWWYYTGNLRTQDGRQLGYQLTFFRRAVVAPQERQERASAWATEQVYMAHFAVSEIDRGRFRYSERLERGAAGLAGAVGEPLYRVWLGDWSVEQVDVDQYQLHAAQDGVILDLLLSDRKDAVLQGEQGYSQKGPEPGNASYYISQTRLETSGEVTLDGQPLQVDGLSWMDHEFSTSALGPEQVGWDWFALQLDDGSEIMVFTLRRADGSPDPYSQGAVIYPDGSIRRLKRDDFQVSVTREWHSPHSGGVYPAGWTLQVPVEGLTLHIRPKMTDQELNGMFIYWEGAVAVEGRRGEAAVSGSGYVELTGYAQSMQSRF